MAYEQKDMTGSLFVNERKQTQSHSDWQGSIKIEGKEYWLAGWAKTGQKGDWISLSVKPKEVKPTEQPKSPPKQVTLTDLETDIPF